MAKASYAPMFETVSGALTKINKKSPHAGDQKMVLATHRKAETTSKDCSRVYLRGLESVTRKTPVSSEELAKRERFATVAAAVATRSKDLGRYSTDRAAYLLQKDQPGGKQSFKSYLWSLELATYDAAHPGE